MKRMLFAVLALLLGLTGRSASALGMETFGNKPLGGANYGDWPGIVPVIDHPSRFYHTWVNGNEHFYYRGDTAALNDLLLRYAEAKTGIREVVLRPGPAATRSFDGTQTIPYGWKLHLVGGIARHLTTLPEGNKVWSPYPALTVHVGGEIELEKIVLPKELTVMRLADMSGRVREGLKSADRTVRGWGAGVLAELDPYSAENLEAVAALLRDPDSWVRLNAAGALSQFGKAAAPHLPLLREVMAAGDARLRERATQSIQAIEEAQDRAAAETEQRETLRRIDRFLAQKPGR